MQRDKQKKESKSMHTRINILCIVPKLIFYINDLEASRLAISVNQEGKKTSLLMRTQNNLYSSPYLSDQYRHFHLSDTT